MPIASIIYIFTILYLVYYDNNNFDKLIVDLFILGCFLDICYFQGYFLKVGTFELSIYSLNSYFFCCILIVYFLFKGIDLPLKYWAFSMVFLILPFVGICYELIMPYHGGTIGIYDSWDNYIAGFDTKKNGIEIDFGTFKWFYIGMINSWAAITLFHFYLDRKYIYYSLNKIRTLAWIPVSYGLIEFVIYNILGDVTLPHSISEYMFGINETSSMLNPREMAGGMYGLQGVCREPSHFAIALFYFLIITVVLCYIENKIFNIKIKKSRLLLIGMICFEMYASGGASAIWYLGVCFISIIVLMTIDNVEINYKHMFAFGGGSIFILCFVLLNIDGENEYYIRFLGAIEAIDLIRNGVFIPAVIMDNLSAFSRFTSIIDCFYMFLERPIVGYGFGSTWCHDGLVGFLVQEGILGLVIWIKVYLYKCKNQPCYSYRFFFVSIIIANIPFGIYFNLVLQLQCVLLVLACSLLVTNSIDNIPRLVIESDGKKC